MSLRSLDGAASLLPMVETNVQELCACGEPATANGRECAVHFRQRLRSVRNGFTPTRHAGQIDPKRSRHFEDRLERYRATRAEGSQPATTRTRDIDRAREASDVTGAAFRADVAARGWV